MKHHRLIGWPAFLLLLLIGSCSRSTVPPSASDGLYGLVNSRFRMSQGGDSLGFSAISILSTPDHIYLHEESVVPGFSEEMHVYADRDMVLDSVRITGSVQGQTIDCFTHHNSNRLQGHSTFPFMLEEDRRLIDTLAEQPFYERALSLFLLPMNLDYSQATQTYVQFNSVDGGLRKIQASFQPDSTVTVPAGTFDCFHLQLSGGVATQNLFIAKSERRIVKITFEETPWQYELLK